MTLANLVGMEPLDHLSGKFSQSDTGSAVRWRLTHCCRDLIDALLRVFQVEQGFKSMRLLPRVKRRGVAGGVDDIVEACH